jgi:hypothetical protein
MIDRSDPRLPHVVVLLPLVLLAVMMGLGLVLEARFYGTLLWQAKLPLAALLAMAFFRRAPR